ncbi:hypothetical protein LXL04_009012 [Taraxacum kok-saghyz]
MSSCRKNPFKIEIAFVHALTPKEDITILYHNPYNINPLIPPICSVHCSNTEPNQSHLEQAMERSSEDSNHGKPTEFLQSYTHGHRALDVRRESLRHLLFLESENPSIPNPSTCTLIPLAEPSLRVSNFTCLSVIIEL